MRKLLALILALLLTGCAPAPAAPEASAAPLSYGELDFSQTEELRYAREFTIEGDTRGYRKITVGSDQTILVVPEGAAVPGEIPGGVTVLRQPLSSIYLVASAAMDYFCKLESVDAITLSSQKESAWYLEEAKAAMAAGRLRYAGKYSAPDYETILAAGCDLAVENAMIYHTPDVLEQIKKLGIPVVIDKSSYEAHPLGRMEWIKFYGCILGKEAQAERYYNGLLESLNPVLHQPSGEKTVAFFYMTAAGGVNVRKASDYISKSISLAGCRPVTFREEEDSGATATQVIQMEAFYNGAIDADILIYNSTVDGELDSLEALLRKAPLLKDFAAVKNGQVYCISKNFYQESLALGDFIQDVHTVASGSGGPLYFLKQLH